MSETTTAPYTPGPWRVVETNRLRHELLVGRGGQSDEAAHEGIARIFAFPYDKSDDLRRANARLIAAAPTMAEALLWIRENLHPKTLGRAATNAELLAITYTTKVLREAGVIPTPVLEPAPEPTMPQRGRPRTKAPKTYMNLDGETVVIEDKPRRRHSN